MSTRRFGFTSPTFTLNKRHAVNPNQPFQPLPLPTGDAPYRLKLEDVLPAERIHAIHTAGKLVFHTTGDTGGVQSGAAQRIVAQHMESDLNSRQSGDKPAFFYHLGDVVYYYGEAEHYYPQFYEPYTLYDAPIFAIPGNHDGDVADNQRTSLAAFVDNFCAPAPHVTPEADDALRQAMTQPNVYWTLLTPYATIIGLYTNVPDGGMLDQDQIDWFHSEMKAADMGKPLIVAMHHPIYSGDKFHGGSVYMGDILDEAMRQANRIPDMVLAAHTHNYQRFTRKVKDTQGRNWDVPYIVAGAGGYFHLHYEQMLNGKVVSFGHSFAHENVILERFRDNRHGFLRLEVTPNEIRGTYLTVPRPHEDWRASAEVFDDFSLNLTTHQVAVAGVLTR